MSESNEEYTCGLDMKGGLNGVRYEQKFVKAPKSEYPMKSKEGKEVANHEAMKISLGC